MNSVKPLIVAGALALAVFVPGVASAAATDGLTVPQADPSLLFVAPSPSQPNYDARLQAFLQATVSDQFMGAYNDNGGVDVLGLPTSAPTADPNNPNFIYQRFQNAVLFYNATEGTTSVLGLG